MGKTGEVFEFIFDFNFSFESDKIGEIKGMWRHLLINMKILITG